MEKIKFGIQVILLLLAFPAWFFAEMKQADKTIRKNRLDNLETIGVKRPVSTDKLKKDIGNTEFVAMPFSKLMVISN